MDEGNNNNKKKKDKLDKVVKSRIKGLGLDALFHQVDVSKKDEDYQKPKKHPFSLEEINLLEKLKRGLEIKKQKKIINLIAAWLKEILTPKASTKISLKLGSTSIKLVEIKNTKENILLTNVLFLPIPPILASNQENREEFILKSLSQEVDIRKINRCFISTIIPRNKVIIKFLKLPTQQLTEIKRMLEFEAERHLPFPLSEVETDFHIIKREENKTYVLLVAVKKEEIAKQLYLLKRIGIKPSAVEVSSIALYNSLIFLSEKKGFSIQINIAATSTDINIVKESKLIFGRGIDWGSKALTLDLSKFLNLSFENAEKIKKENGIILSKETKDRISKDISEKSSLWANYLIAEINKTIQYLQLKEGPVKIDKIILTGGGSKLINLNEYLRDKLKTKVTVYAPPKDIKISCDASSYHKYFPQMSLLLGIALRGLSSRQIEINLLPQKIKYSLQIKRQKMKRITVLAAALIGISISLITPYWIIADRNKQINKFREEIKILKPQLETIQDLRKKIRSIEDYISTKQSCMEVLRQISLIVSPDITIDKFSFDKNKSVVLAGEASSHSSVVTLSRNLSELSIFEDAKIRYTKRENVLKENVDFEIVCSLNN